MKGGTCTIKPVSVVADLKVLVAVAFLMPGSVSVTVRSPMRQLDADRAVVVEVDLDVGVGQQD